MDDLFEECMNFNTMLKFTLNLNDFFDLILVDEDLINSNDNT